MAAPAQTRPPLVGEPEVKKPKRGGKKAADVVIKSEIDEASDAKSKESKQEWDKVQKEAVQLNSRIDKETKAVDAAEAKLNTKKGWGPSVVKYLRECTDAESARNKQFHKDVILAATMFEDKTGPINADTCTVYDEEAKKMSTMVKAHEESYKKHVKHCLGDFVEYTK